MISADWLDASLAPGYTPERWPADYDRSPLANYGYQWWLTDDGAFVGLGKDGQYLYVDPLRRAVLVRQGTAQGEHSWLDTLRQVAADLDEHRAAGGRSRSPSRLMDRHEVHAEHG